MRAAARSLDDGRTVIEPRDLLVALALDEKTAPLLDAGGDHRGRVTDAELEPTALGIGIYLNLLSTLSV